MQKRALITGVTGQDGYYMAELLLRKGYKVYGAIRHNYEAHLKQNVSYDVLSRIILCPVDLLNRAEVLNLIAFVEPHEIYNFAAVSDVFKPWNNLSDIFDINIKIPQYFLEGIISRSKDTKFLQASSSLVFGRDSSGFQNELTVRNPIYPYGVSKNMVDNLISEMRLEFGIKACSAIFFNHESPRRGDNFFSKKIARAAAKIKKDKSILPVGNISVYRDYGYAVDYMEAAYLMLQQDIPKDYVIGTGAPIMMSDYIKKCFDYVGLDYMDHVLVDSTLYRKNDTRPLRADITKISNELGWKPKTSVDELVEVMMQAALQQI